MNDALNLRVLDAGLGGLFEFEDHLAGGRQSGRVLARSDLRERCRQLTRLRGEILFTHGVEQMGGEQGVFTHDPRPERDQLGEVEFDLTSGERVEPVHEMLGLESHMSSEAGPHQAAHRAGAQRIFELQLEVNERFDHFRRLGVDVLEVLIIDGRAFDVGNV